MKTKRQIIRYLMLAAGIIMLLSVVVPHHHHGDGMPCLKSLAGHAHPSHTDSHDCGCNGHNQALFTSLLSHAANTEVGHLFFPLHILFDYINPPVPSSCGQMSGRNCAFYIESLHDSWVTCSGGLRAPPVL